MVIGILRATASVAVSFFLVSTAATPSSALTGVQKCTAMKLKAAGKRYASEMSCYAKAVADPAPEQECLDKAQSKFNIAYAKADALGPCPGDVTEQAQAVRTCVTDAVDDLASGGTSDDCNPAANTGCSAGEKCTWINVTDSLGTIGCVSDGTVANGGACTYGPDGETTGFDNCVGGHICVGGRCQVTCTLSPDSCPANNVCSAYAGTFGDTPIYGACDPQCDPVTQQRLSDGAANCGANDGSVACYMHFDEDKGFCAPVPVEVRNNPANYQQDDVAYGPAPGSAFLNGCAPGFAPLLRSANDQGAPVICMAFCQPAETSSSAPAGAGGTAPYSCTDRGAMTHECKYFWYFEETADPAHNAFGFCWTPENYVADWDINGSNEPHPRCSALPDTDTNGDTIPENTYYGCTPVP